MVNPNGGSYCIAFTPDGLGMAVGSGTSPFLYFYTRPDVSSTTWTQQPNPDVLAGPGRSIAFTPNGLATSIFRIYGRKVVALMEYLIVLVIALVVLCKLFERK
jgi:hypothetical protein